MKPDSLTCKFDHGNFEQWIGHQNKQKFDN